MIVPGTREYTPTGIFLKFSRRPVTVHSINASSYEYRIAYCTRSFTHSLSLVFGRADWSRLLPGTSSWYQLIIDFGEVIRTSLEPTS